MLLVRRITTGIVFIAALAVVLLSAYLIWNAAQFDYLPLNPAFASDVDAHAQQLQERLDAYNRRINAMELMVIILLGISGLYVIVFILASDLNARGIRREVDHAITDAKDQVAKSLVELKEQVRDVLAAAEKDMLSRLEQDRRDLTSSPTTTPSSTIPAEVLQQLEKMHLRLTSIADTRPLAEHVQEVMHYESALPALELLHSTQLAAQIARIYRELARFFRQRDPARAHFYANRAIAMAPSDFETANELGMQALGTHTFDGRESPDYRQARKHFETSLAAEPAQQRAKYGLALIAKAEGDLETALGLLENAIESQNWETKADLRNAALVHYALACVLARRGAESPAGNRAQYLIRATQHLQRAFDHPSRQLEQMLSRDTEEDGDLFALANTPPYANAINDLLLKVCVGAA